MDNLEIVDEEKRARAIRALAVEFPPEIAARIIKSTARMIDCDISVVESWMNDEDFMEEIERLKKENDREKKEGSVTRALAVGVPKSQLNAATGVDDTLIDQWMNDPEFMESVKSEKKWIKDELQRNIVVNSTTSSKSDRHNMFSVTFRFPGFLGESEIEKQLVLKKLLALTKKEASKALKPEYWQNKKKKSSSSKG